MNKALPFHIPTICGYGQFSIALGILDCYPSPETKIWFAESFIQLFASTKTYSLRFDIEYNDNQFMNCPFFDHYIIPISFFNNTQTDIVHFIRDMINNSYYVGFLCDRFYFPFCKREYKQRHSCHFSLVIGYNDDTSTFTLVDYFNQKYSIMDVSYSCILAAFHSEYCNSDQPYEDSILCVRFCKERLLPQPYNPDRLRFLCKEYLKGVTDEKNNIWRGISVNDALIEFVKNKTIKNASVQSIHDHKLALLRRLHILQELHLAHIEKEDYAYFEDLVRRSLVLRNSLIKYSYLYMSNLEADPSTLYSNILSYKQIDFDAMNRFYSLI